MSHAQSSHPHEHASFFERPENSILHAAHEAIVMLDDTQTIVAVNAAAEQAFRCPASNMLGQPLSRLVPAALRVSHEAKASEYMSSESLQQRLVAHRRVTAVRPDGSHFPAEITLSTVNMAGAGPRRYVAALILDLSEQSRLQQELDSFKRRLRSVFELAPVAIWIADNDRIVFANLAAERLFGESHALLGQPLRTLLAEATQAGLHAQVSRVLEGATDVPVVHGHVVRPDGTQREVEIALAALPDHGRTTVQMVVADVTQQRREAAELAESREALRRLSTNVVEAREEERRRIARELHDELGQRLTALKMELAALSALRAAEHQGGEQIDNMIAMVDETLASVRRISTDLRPAMLDDLGLNAAIEWLGRDAARRLGIEVTVRLSENEPPLDDRVATAAFRMVQEALTNVARHAHATDVQIVLRQHEGELELTVQDNGVGYPDDATRRDGSFGLVGMRERAAMLGGRVAFENPAGGGARLVVHLPIAPGEGDGA
ncbi:MAG: PAS domain S-box protein [Piscinibacter sp.]|uniref:PAS domain-containing sensor histidine kinase n=1 Tax=Piscinibacter sp. TaxID=1903157 RepID=UPI003D13E6F9